MENNENNEYPVDLTIVDGIKLEINKEYFAKYIHCQSEWIRIKITRITNDGYAWGEHSTGNGIYTNKSYLIKKITNETILEQFAREWLKNKKFNGFANHTAVPKWFAQMYNDFEENKIQLKFEL